MADSEGGDLGQIQDEGIQIGLQILDISMNINENTNTSILVSI